MFDVRIWKRCTLKCSFGRTAYPMKHWPRSINDEAHLHMEVSELLRQQKIIVTLIEHKLSYTLPVCPEHIWSDIACSTMLMNRRGVVNTRRKQLSTALAWSSLPSTIVHYSLQSKRSKSSSSSTNSLYRRDIDYGTVVLEAAVVKKTQPSRMHWGKARKRLFQFLDPVDSDPYILAFVSGCTKADGASGNTLIVFIHLKNLASSILLLWLDLEVAAERSFTTKCALLPDRAIDECQGSRHLPDCSLPLLSCRACMDTCET